MGDKSQAGRPTQGLIALFGTAMLLKGVDAAIRSYSTGVFAFTYKRWEFTGELAAFLIGSFVVVGAGFLGTAIRNLERPFR